MSALTAIPEARSQISDCIRNDTKDLYESYEPLPLNETSIRILELEDVHSCDHSEPVRGTLRTVDLTARPKYAALSYVWGQTTHFKDTITIDHQTVGVSENCLSAIKQCRKSFGSASIWIDSICIDQSNPHEKEGQIPLMGDIYSKAAVTYIWLGEGDQMTDFAMEFFAEFPLSGDWRRAWFILAKCPGGLIFSRHYRLRMLTSLREVLSRPWIRRLWTLQELLLSPNPIIMCGDRQVSWAQMTNSVAFLCQLENRVAPLYRPAGCYAWLCLVLFAADIHKEDAHSDTPSSPGKIDSRPGSCLTAEPRSEDHGLRRQIELCRTLRAFLLLYYVVMPSCLLALAAVSLLIVHQPCICHVAHARLQRWKRVDTTDVSSANY